MQKDEGDVYGHDGYNKRYIRMNIARDMMTLYDKKWQKSARKGMQRYIEMRKETVLARRIMRDDTCRDMGNEYKASDGNRTKDISIGLKIIQFKHESKCLKTIERKRN